MNLWSVGLTRGGGVKVEGRAAALRSVDRQLAKGNFKLAVKHLRLCQPPLRGFSAAKQVPRRVSSVEELNLSVTETLALQSLLDSILHSIKTSLQSSPLDEEEEE
ncbi:hypothetical protein Tco_0931113, partial [Tanacetum coccineum]